MTSADRRHFDRFPFSARLEVRVDRRSGHAIDCLSADAVDVSVSGFGFHSSLPLCIGDVIAVTLPELDFLDDEGPPAGPSRLRPHVVEDDPDLEIRAVVRHVRAVDGTRAGWFVGAERA